MGMARNWYGPEPGYHLIDTLQTALEETEIFLTNLLNGDMGTVETVSGERDVAEMLWLAYKNSMGLLLMALSSASILGVFLGIMAAIISKRHGGYFFLLATMLGIAAPSFFLAVLLQNLGIKYTTTVGRMLVSMGGYAWDFKHLAMPLLILMARPLAHVTQVTYITLAEIMDEDFIRTAFSKGLTYSRTVIVHALKNLLIPILTAIGVSLRFSLSILPIVEFIYAWPGMGRGILGAIRQGQSILVVSIALAIGLTIQVVNLGLDGLYPLLDPRLRENQ
ncbi:MAG: hypothetical protein B5M51_08960 [Anaerolinea sp. 4484_236]|nr:MAG: hypothetical protein B5M51_08960 [Anaerolinea sp. 4484_236]